MKAFQPDLTKAGFSGITGDYKQDLKNPILEDFTIAAALALKIENAQKLGRSAEDALKFGVGLYSISTLLIDRKNVIDCLIKIVNLPNNTFDSRLNDSPPIFNRIQV